MNRFKKLAITAAAAAAVMAPTLMPSAANATPPTGYGFDGQPHVIVGGGSDTTYRAMLTLTNLWNGAAGCVNNTAVGASMAQCALTAGSADTNTLGNFDHDTVAQAFPVGSSSGIASLNGFIPSGQTNVQYPGAVNSVPSYLGSTATGPNVDFARSSRGPKTSGGNAIGGNELATDTFWGYAQDGIEVALFNNRGTYAQGKAGAGAITPTELYHIWNCDYTTWSQVPSLGITAGAADDGPIVPWGLNSASGTFATFNSYLIANGGAPSGWTVNGQACDRKLANGTDAGKYPFENDIKPLVQDPLSLSTSASSTDNPENWIWFGSFGEFSAFSYKSAVTVGGTLYQATASPVAGKLPSSSKILANTYPIGRTLYHVTRKQDADCATTGSACDFTGNPGPTLPSGTGTDLNVTGGTSGTGGAVREFTRWLCRSGTTAHTVDSYYGTSFSSLIGQGINGAGFTVVPVGLRTAGSACQVLH